MSSDVSKLVGGRRSPPDRSSYYLVGEVDRAMALLDETSAVGFQAIVELLGSVERDALREAWRRVAARHPILTCVRDGRTWRPADSPPFGADAEQPRHDRPPAALRVTPVDGGLRLSLLCSHIAFDGIASVILLRDLRDEYEAVLESRAPSPLDLAPRTLEALVLESPRWRTATAALVRGASQWARQPASSHVDPGEPSTEAATGHALLELGPVLEALRPARLRYHWSTDAILVGVLEKAWGSVFGAAAADSAWLIAQDLRPTLDVTRGIGNLSVTTGVSVADPRSDLFSAIDRVDAEIRARRDDVVVAAKAMARSPFPAEPLLVRMLRRSRRLRYHRSVSNVGQLGESLSAWGSASLHRVWFVGPLAHPPYTTFIAAGHGPSTLVSVRTSPLWLTDEHASALEKAALNSV